MPQKDMSSKLGSSPSKVINRVVQNNKNVQQPGKAPGILKSAFNKHPEPCK